MEASTVKEHDKLLVSKRPKQPEGSAACLPADPPWIWREAMISRDRVVRLRPAE